MPSGVVDDRERAGRTWLAPAGGEGEKEERSSECACGPRLKPRLSGGR
ncbi:MAG: hypothetical protein ACRD08_19125 [Acidimicrobiales bacterium]